MVWYKVCSKVQLYNQKLNNEEEGLSQVCGEFLQKWKEYSTQSAHQDFPNFIGALILDVSAGVEGVHDSTSLSGLSKLICVLSQVSVDDVMLAGVEGASHSGEQEVVFLLLWLINS